MLRVRDGDAESFATLYDRHSGLAYGIALRICGRGLAEDVTQAIFLSVWRGRDSYEPMGRAFRGWLATISRNRALDAIRSQSSKLDEPVGGDDELEWKRSDREPENVPLTFVERRDAKARLQGVLGKLPQPQREVIELAYFGGLTHSEIAEKLAVPSGTVKGRMRLGLEKLRRQPGLDQLAQSD